MLPNKENLDAYRVAKQNKLCIDMYHDLIIYNIDKVIRNKCSQGYGERQGLNCLSI